MAELSLPHASITKIPNMAPATPTLWNSAYTEIDENFAAIKTKVNSLDQATQAASESSSGIVQLATSDEVIAGTEETKVVTPAGLKTLVATETRKGLVDLATENDFDTYAEATNPVEVKKVGTVASIVKWVKKAIAKMAEHIVADGKNTENKVLAIAHCNCPERAREIERMILDKIKVKDSFIVETGGISTMYANDGGIIVVL